MSKINHWSDLVGDPQYPEQSFDAEEFEERAAIMEFDGGMTREEAERLAWSEQLKKGRIPV